MPIERKRKDQEEMSHGQLYGGGGCYFGDYHPSFRIHREGHGSLYDSNTGWLIYEGGWSENDKHGAGVYFDYDGNCYEGNWQYGEMDGCFLKTTPSGVTSLIKYKGGKLVDSPSTLVMNRSGTVAVMKDTCFGTLPCPYTGKEVDFLLKDITEEGGPLGRFCERVRQGQHSSIRFCFGL